MIRNNTYRYIKGNTGDLSINLNLPQDIHYTHVNILSFRIDYSFYMIEDGHNTFIINEDGTPILITLTPGNYSATALKEELNIKINKASIYDYTITIETNSNKVQNGKWTFTTSNNNPTELIFDNDIRNKIYKLLGFNFNSTNEFTTGILISQHTADFSLTEQIEIHSDIIDNINDDIIDIVNISNFIPYSKIEYINNRCLYTKKKVKKNLSNCRIYITDEKGNIINTNNGMVNIDLVFYIEDNMDYIKEYIRLKIIK